MTRILRATFATMLIGCGSSASTNGAAPTPVPVPPEIVAVTPSSIFRGRTTTVSVTTRGLSLSEKPSLTVGGSGVTIANLHQTSDSLVVADVTVPSGVADESLDLSIEDVQAKGALALTNPITLRGPSGHVAQGGMTEIELINLDLAHPPTSYVATVAGGPGVVVDLSSVDSTSLRAHAAAAPTAPAGLRDLKIVLTSYADDGKTVVSTFESVVTGALQIDGRTFPSLAAGVSTAIDFPPGSGPALATLGGASGSLVYVSVGATTPSGLRALLEVLDPDVGLAAPVAYTTGSRLLGYWPGKTDPILAVSPLDAISTHAHLDVTFQSTKATATAESEPNETSASATTIGNHAVMDAALGDVDLDWFAVDVAAAGTLIVATAAGSKGEEIDTNLRVTDASGITLTTSTSDSPGLDSPFSSASIDVTPGRYFVEVSPRDVASVGPYRVLVFTR